jgi:transcriptional regulator with PAS, ATPase and Fis domain
MFSRSTCRLFGTERRHANSGRVFVKRYAEKAAKQITKIDNDTLKLCQSYHRPGNIRELQNIIERSVILCIGDTFAVDAACFRVRTHLSESHQVFSRKLSRAMRRNSSKRLLRKATEKSLDRTERPPNSVLRGRRRISKSNTQNTETQ